MTPLALVAYSSNRWRHLPFASRKFCHRMMPHPLFAHFGHQNELFALIANLTTRRVLKWHNLLCFQSWPPDCIICIATLPWIALLTLSVSIELVSSSARVTSVKSHKGVLRTSGPKDRTPGLPGSDKNRQVCIFQF